MLPREGEAAMANDVEHARRADRAGRAGQPGGDLTERGRERILRAALEEFAIRGFDGTTTAAIARQAGVTQPLVHYHFTTKVALWQARGPRRRSRRRRRRSTASRTSCADLSTRSTR